MNKRNNVETLRIPVISVQKNIQIINIIDRAGFYCCKKGIEIFTITCIDFAVAAVNTDSSKAGSFDLLSCQIP
jgi:hypothetical protein